MTSNDETKLPSFNEGRNTADDDAKLENFEYDWDTIRSHNNESSLWIVLYGRVYDVTDFQIDHPGGPDVLQDIAGQDATEEFENILHTEKARKMCKKYLIGKVKGAKLGDLFSEVDQGKDNDGSSDSENRPAIGNTLVTISFLVVAGILAYNFYLKGGK